MLRLLAVLRQPRGQRPRRLLAEWSNCTSWPWCSSTSSQSQSGLPVAAYSSKPISPPSILISSTPRSDYTFPSRDALVSPRSAGTLHKGPSSTSKRPSVPEPTSRRARDQDVSLKEVDPRNNSSILSDATFQDLGITDDEILAHLHAELHMRTATHVQASAIPHMLHGSNCAIQSHAGSGKTLAYLVPLLQTIRAHVAHAARTANTAAMADAPLALPARVQAIIITPTIELAMQILRVAKQLVPPKERELVQQAVGGAQYTRQLKAVRRGRPYLLVASPSRLRSLLDSPHFAAAVRPMAVRHVVVEEADAVWQDAAMRDDVEYILRRLGTHVKPHRQTVFVGASLTPRSTRDKLMEWPGCRDGAMVFTSAQHSEPLAAVAGTGGGGAETTATSTTTTTTAAAAAEVSSSDTAAVPLVPLSRAEKEEEGEAVKDDALEASAGVLPPNLQHYSVVAPPDRKLGMVRRVLNALGSRKALAFCVHKDQLLHVREQLSDAPDMAVTILHADLTKLERQNVVAAFERGAFRLLAASDVASRGLDFSDVDTVVHLDMATSPLLYAQRSGRCGRMGAQGNVVTLVGSDTLWHLQRLHAVAQRLNVDVQEVTVDGKRLVPYAAPDKGQAAVQQYDQQYEQYEHDIQAPPGPSRRLVNDAAHILEHRPHTPAHTPSTQAGPSPSASEPPTDLSGWVAHPPSGRDARRLRKRSRSVDPSSGMTLPHGGGGGGGGDRISDGRGAAGGDGARNNGGKAGGGASQQGANAPLHAMTAWASHFAPHTGHTADATEPDNTSGVPRRRGLLGTRRWAQGSDGADQAEDADAQRGGRSVPRRGSARSSTTTRSASVHVDRSQQHTAESQRYTAEPQQYQAESSSGTGDRQRYISASVGRGVDRRASSKDRAAHGREGGGGGGGVKGGGGGGGGGGVLGGVKGDLKALAELAQGPRPQLQHLCFDGTTLVGLGSGERGGGSGTKKTKRQQRGSLPPWMLRK